MESQSLACQHLVRLPSQIFLLHESRYLLTWFGWNHLIVCIGLTIVLTSGLINIINIHIAPVYVCFQGDHLVRIKYPGSILVLKRETIVRKIGGENDAISLPCFEASLSVRTNVSSCGGSDGLILRTVVHKDDIWMVSDLKSRKSQMYFCKVIGFS